MSPPPTLKLVLQQGNSRPQFPLPARAAMGRGRRGAHQVVDGQHPGARLQQRVFEEHPQRDRAPGERAPGPAAGPRPGPAAAASSADATAAAATASTARSRIRPLRVLGLRFVLVLLRRLLARTARRGQRLRSCGQREAAGRPLAPRLCSPAPRASAPPGPPYLPWPRLPAPGALDSGFPARDAAPPRGGEGRPNHWPSPGSGEGLGALGWAEKLRPRGCPRGREIGNSALWEHSGN